MEKEHTTEPATTCRNLENLKMQPDTHEKKFVWLHVHEISRKDKAVEIKMPESEYGIGD